MPIRVVLCMGESRALRALDFPPPGCEEEEEEDNAC